MTSGPSKIIRQELVSIQNVTGMNNMEFVVSNDLVNIRLAMYWERRKHLPTVPKNIAEVLQQLKDPSLVTSRKEKSCFVDEDTNIVFFTCESNLKYLRQFFPCFSWWDPLYSTKTFQSIIYNSYLEHENWYLFNVFSAFFHQNQRHVIMQCGLVFRSYVVNNSNPKLFL